ncbi:MAG TPA: OmpA family protein [Methylocella sp.]|jgi:outer membrane protein OmpA-like peptidoglycan-associated protein
MDDFGQQLEEMVTRSLQIVAAGVAIVGSISGKALWAPQIPELPYCEKIFGVTAGIGLAILYAHSKFANWDFELIAAVTCIVGVVFAVIYVYLRIRLCFKCKDDETVYTVGLKLKAHANKVLAGDFAGLPEEYVGAGMTRPADERDYFCKSGKDKGFIWEIWSYALAQLLLFIAYGLAMVPLTWALFAATIAASQVELQITESATQTRIELPADVLFDFDRADIRPDATKALENAAALIKERAVKVVTIEGHTDAKGTPEYNQKLSERRAAAIYDWFVGRDELREVKFTSRGFGAARPNAPNVKQDGSDNPGGRQKNRRVEIILNKE